MARNFETRIARLEEGGFGGDEPPGGGVLIVELRDGETEEEALKRALARPEIAQLRPAQRRRLVPLYLKGSDMWG